MLVYFFATLKRSWRLFLAIAKIMLPVMAIVHLALGADIWVVLVGRLLVTLAVIALLARLTYRGQLNVANETS